MASKNSSLKLFLALVRALFPKWNFFDFVGHHFELSFRVQDQKAWEVISFQAQRKPFELFSNGTVNLTLAKINLIEHFAAEVQGLVNENPKISNLDLEVRTSYLMLESLIRDELKAYGQNFGSFQFKVSAVRATEKIELFYSDWISTEAR